MPDPKDKFKDGKDPFKDSSNKVVDWTDRDGQYNLKIVGGSDDGRHRFYDQEHGRSGEAGIQRAGDTNWDDDDEDEDDD